MPSGVDHGKSGAANPDFAGAHPGYTGFVVGTA
jgi:hypothetical protein